MSRVMDRWISELLKNTQTATMPIMTYPGLPLIGKTVMDIIRSGQAQYECIKKLAETYPSIAALTLMDLSVEAEAFGCPIRYSEDEVPTVIGRIVTDMDSALALPVPQVGAGRTAVYLEAARLAAQNIHDRPVFGGHIGPFSLVARLCDMTEVMLALMIDPEKVHQVLEKSTAFLVEYARAFKQAGAHGVVIAEPASGLLSPDQCTEFSSNYVRKIVEAVQDKNFMVILHNCGKTTDLVPSLLSTRAKGLHFGNAVDMAQIMPQIPAHILAFGNIDPSSVFRNGTPKLMKSKTMELLEKTAAYKNFILSSGCDIPPGTPLENVNAFFATLEDFNASGEEPCAEALA